MYQLTVAVGALLLLLLSSASTAQITKRYDFHVFPQSFFVNEYVADPVMYFFTDDLGHLYRSRYVRSIPITKVSEIDLKGVRDMEFINGAHGLAVGLLGAIVTKDSGESWHSIPQLSNGTPQWRDLEISYMGTIFAVSSERGLWISTNDGREWSKLLDGRFHGISFTGSRGVLTAFEGGNSYYTTDAGVTWSPSTKSVTAGKSCYWQAEKVFVAVDAKENLLYKSTSGESWDPVVTLEYQTYGDIFTDCKNLYIPAYYLTSATIVSGYLRGTFEDLFFVPIIPGTHGVYTFWNNRFYYQSGSIHKPGFTYTMESPPELKIRTTDIDVVIPRCSTFSRTFSVEILPHNMGNASISVVPVTTSPAIVLNSTLGEADSVLTFTVTLRAGQAAEASYLITAERCMTATTIVNIKVKTTGAPLLLAADNLNFGQIGACATSQRWVKVRNPDCEPMILKSATIRQPNDDFNLLSTDFPRTIAPGGYDSLLIECDPSAVGKQTGLIDLTYSILSFNRAATATVTATVSGSTAVSGITDTLNFGTVSTCNSSVLTTSLTNSGCDKIQIEDIRLRSNSKFALVKSPIGQWLEPGEEAEVELRALTDQTGNFAEDLEIYGKSESNAQVQLRIALLSTVTPSTVGHELSTIGKLTGLTTCNFIDTSVTITNTSTCTDLNVLDVISSNAAVMLREPFLPVTLKPTESATYRLRVQSDQVGAVTSSVNILTDLFGQVTSTIDFDIDEERLETIVMSTPEDPFATTQCKPVTRTFAFETVGCGYLHWSDIQLSPAFTSASRFTLAMPDDQPSKIAAGERIAFDVTYNPDLTGDDQADLIVIDDRGNVLYQLPLLGTVEDTKTSIGLAMQIDRTEPLRTNEMLRVTIAATDQVDQASGLTQMMTELHFDRDLFRIETIDAATGINVTQSAIDAGEMLTFSAQPFELTKDQVLTTIVLRPAVTSQTSTDITLTGLTLNDGDTEFARCMMTPSTTLSTTPATVVLDCAERILNDAMNDRLTFRINAVHPMPAQSGEPIWLDIESEGTGEATLQVIDALGRVVAREDHEFTTGTSRIALRSALSSGYHTLLVRSQSGTSSRPIMVR